jgi:hypothetical protein
MVMCGRRRAALLLLSAWPAAAAAQEFVGGWEGSPARGYAFASPRLGVRLGGGASLDLRLAASYLYYEVVETGGVTAVRSPGASAGMAVRWSGGALSAAAGAGIEQRWTMRKQQSGPEVRRIERGLAAQAEVFVAPAGRTTVSFLAAYGQANRYLWTRLGLLYRTSMAGAVRPGAGIEATTQGNADVRAWQVGAVASLELPRLRASLQARSGVAWLRHAGAARESRAYFGAGVYRAF